MLGAAAEEHLTQLSAPSADERQPTVSRGEIAFIRRERGSGRTYDTIRIGDTTGGARATNVLVKVDIRDDTLSDPALAFGPKLPTGSLAYVVNDPGPYGFARKRVRVLDLRATSSRNAYTAVSGGANFANVTRPSWDEFSGLLYFARTNNGSGAGNRSAGRTRAPADLRVAVEAGATFWIAPARGLFVADASSRSRAWTTS